MWQPDTLAITAMARQQQLDLPTTIREGRINLADKRQLAYCVYGDAHGEPVYFFHGFPGSRIQATLIADLARVHHLKIISADRPGFGQSTPHDRRTITGFADDTRQLADHLGHARFGVLGISCGGPYALACAHQLGNRVSHIGLMAGIGPMDIPSIRKEQAVILKLMFSLARVNPVLITPLLMLDNIVYKRDPEQAVATLSRMLTPPDQAFIKDNPHKARLFGYSLAEAYRQGIRGPSQEAALITGPRGFAMHAIQQPTDVFQGVHDKNVPPVMGRYIADSIPNARYHQYENDGHLSIVINAFSQYAKHFRNRHTASLPA